MIEYFKKLDEHNTQKIFKKTEIMNADSCHKFENNEIAKAAKKPLK